jgi:uncharacterized membrane protein
MSVNLRRAMIVVAVLGLALAAYLTYVHYSGTRPACTAGDACTKVQTSVYSKIGGVPVALIGLIGYIGILGSLLLPDRDDVRLLTLLMTVIGICFSGYLTYRELFTLKTICEECATSAVLMALLFVAAATRYVMGDPATAAPAGAAPAPVTGGKPAARQKIAS